MLKITLRETYDDKPNLPSLLFTVMEARASLREVVVDVSVEQAQAIIIGLWRLLPPDARPVPGWPAK